MKKFISILAISAIILSFPTTASANSFTNNTITYIEFLDNGDYFETTLENISGANPLSSFEANIKTAQQITKTKTIAYKTSEGKLLWDISITATFTYNGSTSKCILCSHNAKSYANSWNIKSVSSYKKDNYATATAIVTHSGNSVNTLSKQVTITCSKTGNVY